MEKIIDKLRVQMEYLENFVEALEGVNIISERDSGKTIIESLGCYHNQGTIIQSLIDTIFREHGDKLIKNQINNMKP